jgi:AraC-like DNA-binding protein/quercetin dioxygenase-like cupin family protein
MNKDLLKENRIHGNTTYPVSVYSMECSSNNILDCHWHDEMELLLVIKGQAVFQVATSCYEVYAGQALFINSGELHAGYSLNNSPCNYIALVFHPDVLCSNEYDIIRKMYIKPLLEKQIVFPTHLNGQGTYEGEILRILVRIINQNIVKPYAYEIQTKADLLNIFSYILNSSSSVKQDSTYKESDYKLERIKIVLKYIHDNYNEKISLSELSNLLNMSNEHFCRFFKQVLKRSPMDYLNYYRIQKAANLLEKSTDKISSIALDVGFDNVSYFISMFRRYLNSTPSKYRKNSTHT